MSYWDYVEYKELIYIPSLDCNMVNVTMMTMELDIPGSVFVCCNLWRDHIHSSYINPDFLFLSLLKIIFRNGRITYRKSED